MKEKGVDIACVNYALPKLRCKLCQYVWFPRKSGEILNCPSCRSIDWNGGVKKEVIIPTIICPKCGKVWSPRCMSITECVFCKKKLINKGINKGIKKD